MAATLLNEIKALYHAAPTAATASAAHQLVDRLHRTSKNPDLKKVQCKKGCTFCCHIDLDIADQEAQLIVEYCEEKKIFINTAYLEKQAAETDRARSPHARCEFLKNKLCSIYPVRPIMCRKYLVVSDPKLCDASGKVNDVLYIQNWPLEIAAEKYFMNNPTNPIAKQILKAIQFKTDERQRSTETKGGNGDPA